MGDHHIDDVNLCTKRQAKRNFREGILSSWGCLCAYCGEPADTLDHVRPRAAGGETRASNLIAACKRCNQAKGSEEWRSWYRRQRAWTQPREDAVHAWIAAPPVSDIAEEAVDVRRVRNQRAGESERHDSIIMCALGRFAPA